jgi:anaerobic selenocysteine-containing dehydrogenase
MAVRTITCIPGVTGDWRYPGGGAAYDTRGFFGVNWSALYRDDLRPPGTRTLSMTRLGEGLLEVREPPVKALFIYGSNPLASVPHQSKIRRGLQRPDLFTVVAEHFRTGTVEYADIVLPATMQLEQTDLQIAYGHLYVSWNGSRPRHRRESVCRRRNVPALARRMGLDIPCLYDSDDEIARQILDSGHPALRGITLDELKARGWMRLNYRALRAVRRRLPHRLRQARVRLPAYDEGRAGSSGRLHPTVRGGATGYAAGRTVPAGIDRGGRPLLSQLAVRQHPRPDEAIRGRP